MKHCMWAIIAVLPLVARNPFFLDQQKQQPAVADFVLKGTLIGVTPAAYLEHQGQSYAVIVGDIVDECEVAEIHGGLVCLKRKNGTRCTLRLDEERNEG